MHWLTAKLFGPGTKQPFQCRVVYRQPDGTCTEGWIALWATDARAALQQIHDLLPAHQPCITVELTLREES